MKSDIVRPVIAMILVICLGYAAGFVAGYKKEQEKCTGYTPINASWLVTCQGDTILCSWQPWKRTEAEQKRLDQSYE